MKTKFTHSLILLLSMAWVAMAQPGPGHSGHHEGFGGPGFWLELGLEPSQQVQLKELMSQKKEDRGEFREERMKAEMELHVAIFDAKPDVARIEKAKAKLLDLEKQMIMERVEHMQKLAQILTPAQRTKFLELQKERKEERREDRRGDHRK